MKTRKDNLLTLDKFIEESLYNKKNGYYMKKNPFGAKGDFITSPNISILFSEMIAIWIISFWENLKCPNKFNLIELGAGNGEMMKTLISTFKKFPKFKKSCDIKIFEKSIFLKNLQKKNIKNENIEWLKNLNELNNLPSIFIANEFFDALPIKQFIKKKNKWYERHIKISHQKNSEFKDILYDMKKFENSIKLKWYERCVNFTDKQKIDYLDVPFNIINFEKKIQFKISQNQKFIEYSFLAAEYLKIITSKIKYNSGGILIIDYGYNDKKIKNTLQAVSKHKYINVLKGFKNSDITYNLNLNLFNQIIKKFGTFNFFTTNQKNFLTKLGILKRAEILSKNMTFSNKVNVYFRVKRLIDEKQMGDLFKVIFITNKKNKFKLGF